MTVTVPCCLDTGDNTLVFQSRKINKSSVTRATAWFSALTVWGVCFMPFEVRTAPKSLVSWSQSQSQSRSRRGKGGYTSAHIHIACIHTYIYIYIYRHTHTQLWCVSNFLQHFCPRLSFPFGSRVCHDWTGQLLHDLGSSCTYLCMCVRICMYVSGLINCNTI